MRALLFLALVLAISPPTLAVDVPYKTCGNGHLTPSTVESNVWPPVKGQDLVLNATGTLDEDVTDGKYTINVKVDGFPLPAITGSISQFKPLPWQKGPFNFTYTQSVPSEAPSGSYSLQLVAKDQLSSSITCVALSFTLSNMGEPSVSASLPAAAGRRHSRIGARGVPRE